eukprot:3875438-Rhodomonas_salina.1
MHVSVLRSRSPSTWASLGGGRTRPRVIASKPAASPSASVGTEPAALYGRGLRGLLSCAYNAVSALVPPYAPVSTRTSIIGTSRRARYYCPSA